MFHVKHSHDWPLKIEDIWDVDQLPYPSSVLNDLEAPWKLLVNNKLSEIIDLLRGAGRQIEVPLSGLVQQDCLYHEGEILHGDIQAEEVDGATKGKMVLSLNGKTLPGASLIQAGAYFAKGPIYIGCGVAIHSGTSLSGPIYLHNFSEVRHGALIRGNLVAGERSTVGHATEIKNSLLHTDAKAPHFAYVGDSILGARSNLGAGTKVSNLKITGTEITIPHLGPNLTPWSSSSAGSGPGSGEAASRGLKYATGMRKLGAIVGDDVQTGCNTVTNPGVIFGRACMVYPGTVVRCGVYPPQSWINPPENTTNPPSDSSANG